MLILISKPRLLWNTSLLKPKDQGVIPFYCLRWTFLQIVKANEDEGMELGDFWKYYILQGVKNIAASWKKVKPNNLKWVWNKYRRHYFWVICQIWMRSQLTLFIWHQLPNVEVPDDEFNDLLNDSHSQELRISLNSKHIKQQQKHKK